MKHFINPELGISARHVSFERWLGRVEDALWASDCHAVLTAGGVSLLASSEAISAFENGVSASDYALQMLAGAA